MHWQTSACRTIPATVRARRSSPVRCGRTRKTVRADRRPSSGGARGWVEARGRESAVDRLVLLLTTDTQTRTTHLYVVTLGALVDFRMKLLLGTRVTVVAIVSRLTVHRVAPFVALLDAYEEW